MMETFGPGPKNDMGSQPREKGKPPRRLLHKRSLRGFFSEKVFPSPAAVLPSSRLLHESSIAVRYDGTVELGYSLGFDFTFGNY